MPINLVTILVNIIARYIPDIVYPNNLLKNKENLISYTCMRIGLMMLKCSFLYYILVTIL